MILESGIQSKAVMQEVIGLMIGTGEATRQADKLVGRFGTRDPERLAEEMGIIVMPCPFHRQKGAYKVIERNRFIFIKEDLPQVMYSIVLLHEIGHDILHRHEAVRAGGFQEFNIFDMSSRRMEYEANIFAAQVALPDDEVLEYILQGYDVGQIARAMESDINLMALKVAELSHRGYSFQRQEYRSDFLNQ